MQSFICTVPHEHVGCDCVVGKGGASVVVGMMVLFAPNQ